MQQIELEDSEIPVPIENELDLRIHDAFMAHDFGGNKIVDAETLGIIIRALGLFPTNEEVNVIVENTQKKNQPGIIHLVSFLPYITKEIIQGKYRPESIDKLYEAFKYLDTEHVGYLTNEQLENAMTKYGEPFDEDEMAEMLEIMFNNYTKKIHYEEYIHRLKPKEKDIDEDIYILAARIEAEKLPKLESKKRLSQMFSQPFLLGN